MKKRAVSLPAPLNFSLERTIHHTDGSDQILEKVTKTDAVLLGNNRLVAHGHRFQKPKIELVVELKGDTIQGLKGVGMPTSNSSDSAWSIACSEP